jgi:cellulose biosynthesis protein BcsQ
MKGIRTLAVDLDPQANLAGDFGARAEGAADDGRSLLESVADFAALEVVPRVRPGVDLVPAGACTRELSDWLSSARREDPTVILAVREALATISHHYDLILIDTPPAPAPMAQAGIHAANWVLTPIRADFASIDGLEQVRYGLERMSELGIPAPHMLGVALFDVHSQSTAVIGEIREAVAERVPWAGPVFDTVIRRSERSALDMRRWGLLAGEYRDKSSLALATASAKHRIASKGLEEAVTRFSRAAEALAHDYDHLGEEALGRMAKLMTRAA